MKKGLKIALIVTLLVGVVVVIALLINNSNKVKAELAALKKSGLGGTATSNVDPIISEINEGEPELPPATIADQGTLGGSTLNG